MRNIQLRRKQDEQAERVAEYVADVSKRAWIEWAMYCARKRPKNIKSKRPQPSVVRRLMRHNVRDLREAAL